MSRIVANEETGLFIGIFAAEEYVERYGQPTEAPYVVRDNGSGLEECQTYAEAARVAAEWAADTAQDSPLDAPALIAFIRRILP